MGRDRSGADQGAEGVGDAMSGYGLVWDIERPNLTPQQRRRRATAADAQRLRRVAAEMRRATVDELGDEFVNERDRIALEVQRSRRVRTARGGGGDG